MSFEARIKELNLELPNRPLPLGVYKLVLIDGGLAYVSGHGPIRADGSATCGRLGENVDKETGYAAARQTGLNMLSNLRQILGSLDAIERLVKTTGFVNSAPDFKDQPAVVNGFSEMMRDVFGPENGLGARSAIGVASLPAGWAVEIEAVFRLVAK
jgi:enamine deaminase RidA (YjgF/YER057c/UK114 family)